MREPDDDAPGDVVSEIFEAIASLGAAVMAICGIVGIYAPIMAAAAAIVFGVALAANGSRVLRRYDQIAAHRSGPLRFSILIAGLMGAALAVFALFGADSAFLTPLASVVFGAGLVLKSNVAWELFLLGLVGATDSVDRGRGVCNEIGGDAVGLALSGFASGALGAIAMAGGPNDLTLNLIALMVAASTLALWSRSAVTVMGLLARPISLGRHARVAHKLWRDEGLG